MTRYVPLCSVSLVFVLAPRLPAQQTAPRPALATGTLAGIIRDATSGRPLPHTLVTVGYLTRGFRRAAMTDAHGRNVIQGLPATASIDTFAFAQGYFYHHGKNQSIRTGRTTTYSYSLPRDTYAVTHPRILSVYGHAVDRRTARLGMVAVQGQAVFSNEMMAISPRLGLLVVLWHGPGLHYDGIVPRPTGAKPGVYRFYYIATEDDCFEPKTFPHVDVHLG